jgi:hypothetical protein
MRSRTAVLTAALAMAPLGAQAADLVVWWEQGFYPQEDEAARETIAAFEQDRQAGRACLLSAAGAAGQNRGDA